MLVVKSVVETEPPGDTLLISFMDSGLGIALTKNYLKEKGLEDIKPGQRILIKGERDNSDEDLWNMSSIDIRPVS